MQQLTPSAARLHAWAQPRHALWALLAGAVAFRVLLAFASRGLEFDIRSFELVAEQLEAGQPNIYGTFEEVPNRWPYPPGYFPLIWLAGRMADLTGTPLHGWIQLPPIAADVAIALLVHRALGWWGASERLRLTAAALVLVGPVFLVNSGYHGQFDSFAILPAVAALVVWERGGPGNRALTAGLLIGTGIALKTVPGLMLLALLPTVRSRREALMLVGAAAAVPSALLLPFLVADPSAVVAALKYAGIPGAGGLTLVLQPDSAGRWLTEPFVAPNLPVRLVTEAPVVFNAVVLIGTGALLAWRRVGARQAAVVIWLAVWTFGTGIFFGYFVWGLPFLLLAGRLRLALALQVLLVLPISLFYLGPWEDRAVILPYAGAMIAVWLVSAGAYLGGVGAALGRPPPAWVPRLSASARRGGERVRALGVSPGEAACGAALVAWAFAPLADLVRHAWKTGERFTGADGLFAGDQLNYLWWIRDAGDHGLMSNGFDLAPATHVYLEPMFAISGVLWRFGVDLGWSYQLWKPVATAVLLAGFALYVRRTVSGEPARTAALVLSLFFAAPAAAVTAWLGVGGAEIRADTFEVLGRMFPGVNLHGYLPAAIAFGLMPFFLLAIERVLAPDRRARGRSGGWYAGAAALAGALAAWLHPWQGVVLLLVVAGVVAWGRLDRGYLRLWLPVTATLAPIVYYFGLSRLDDAWSIAQQQNEQMHLDPVALVLALGPLLALAALGVRRPRDLQDRILLLWPLAALAAYAITPSVPAHALGGASLPLAVLAVRGWSGMSRPLPAAVAVALLCVPGMVLYADHYRDLQQARVQPHWLTTDEARALDHLESLPGSGGILARPGIAPAVPAATGRRVWVAHPSFTPDYGSRARRSEELFTGRLRGAEARALIRETGAEFLFAGCASGDVDLRRSVGTAHLRVRRFGCATVYEVRRG